MLYVSSTGRQARSGISIRPKAVSLSLFRRRYFAYRENRGNSRSKVHPRTVSRLLLLLVFPPLALFSLERARGGIEGWKFTRHGFRSSFAPRSYESRRLLERTAQIEISRLDTSSTRCSARAEGNFSFRGSIRRLDNAPTPTDPRGGPRSNEQISFRVSR